MPVNILAELERIGWGFDWANEENIKVTCPFHEDKTPSCFIHLKNEQFYCQAASCKQKGDFISFLAGALKVTRATIKLDLEQRYNLHEERPIEIEVVERCHSAIWNAQPLLRELYDRGVTDDDIREYRLGVRNGRITIPVKSQSGLYVNIRSYLPGAPGALKMRNLKGRSAPRLFPAEQLKYQKIVITGGEVKAIVAARILNPKGIGVVCVTGGEGSWLPEFTLQFRGKEIWVLMDIDAGGRKAARSICTQLYTVAKVVHDVLLPLDIDKYPKGDVNDFVAKEKGDLLSTLANAEPFVVQRKPKLENVEPEKVSLLTATHADTTAKRIAVTAVVSTLDIAPYIIPKTYKVHCDRSQKFCTLCPVYSEDADKQYDLQPESSAILELVAQPKSKQLPVLMAETDIPAQCRVCSVEPTSFYNIEDARISPRLEISSRANDKTMVPAVCIGDGLETNETYEMVGRMYPHPLTQQSTLLISQYKASQDALSSYKVKCGDKLRIFQPESNTIQGCIDKLNHIVSDFESNVTRIFCRRLIHLYADLTYHSPLLLNIDGKNVKGWVETLIIGDSSQGKSETVAGLQQHYGLGEKIECKNASVAGLLGGVQQLGTRWFITWGIIPTHDKRLVILEELKGANIEVISKLTDMRSSGFAEIDKIQKRKTFARTRLIALSNPRPEHKTISQYNFGIEAIRELVGNLEDIRRFDACLVVERGEIDHKKVQELRNNRPEVEHIYTASLCRELVLWAWTRTVNQVNFEDCRETLLMLSGDLCNRYSDVIPIVDRGSMVYKLARLSAALAARLYSTDDGETLIVRRCHVEYIHRMLGLAYGSKAFGYEDYTEAQSLNNNLLDPEVIKNQINSTPYPGDFVKQMLYTNKIELQDLQDWCSYDRTAAQTLLSMFVRKHALIRDGRNYRKTSPFIELLKSLETVERPEFIKEEF